MNNKEASINKVDELVNRASLPSMTGSAAAMAIMCIQSELMYSVIGDTLAADYENLDLYDTPEEALQEVEDFLKAGDIVTVLEMAESDWQPYIDIDGLIENFQDQAVAEGGDASEPWNDFIASEGMTAGIDELDKALNTVLKRWLDKYRVTAGWYQETGKKCRYSYDGIGFIRL